MGFDETKQNSSQKNSNLTRFRIFIASPGDVPLERKLAREAINHIGSERRFRNRIDLEIIAWDQPGAAVAMEAGLTPQEAIAEGLPKPEDCDLAVVILWSRIGTQLPADFELKEDGLPYLSGTEWEYLNAIKGKKNNSKPANIWVYRRTGAPEYAANDPELPIKLDQWHKLENFFANFTNPDGSLNSGFNPYEAPDDFRQQFEHHLRDRLDKLLESLPQINTTPILEKTTVVPSWEESPYPGLKAFTPEQAPIYFGRGREVDQLLLHFSDPKVRFVVVVGVSGSGKSSLVKAGLLPRLRSGIIGHAPWIDLMFTPGERGANPFLSFAYALNAKLNLSNQSETELSWSLQTISSEDRDDHSSAENLLRELLKSSDSNSEVLIVIDQFEELFTQCNTDQRDKFLLALEHIVTLPRFRAIATLRADFYERAIREPVLANLLRLDRSTFPLDPPAMGAILQMIIRPAEAAGVELQDGLAQRLLDDAGSGPGAMPLIAFTLNQLYERTEGADFISIDAYTAFGGVKGAVQQRANSALEGLPKHINLSVSLPALFSTLVEVNEQEIATRRRVAAASLPEDAKLLAERLIDARLLVSSKGEDNQPTVEVAHEIVLSGWEQLQQWILKHSAALRARRDLEKAANEWDKASRSGSALRTGTMLKRYEGAAEPHSATATEYLGACQQRRKNYRAALFFLFLLSAFTLEYIRFVYIKHPDYPLPLATKAFFIQYKLKPLPEPDMVEIPAGKFLMGSPPTERGRENFEDQKDVTIAQKFSIGTHEVTFDEYDLFVFFIKREGGCADGHKISLPDDEGHGRGKMPVINVSWHDAQCYAEWLSNKTGKNYRLPTESEWEYAARAGTQTPYPWGDEVTHDNANYGTEECCNGLIRGKDQWFYTSPVGSFAPNKWGLYDTAGNVWEWTCSDYVEKYDDNEQACHSKNSTSSYRSLRGGSLDNGGRGMRSASRYAFVASNRRYVLGFRLVISPYPKDAVPPPNPCENETVVLTPNKATGAKFDIPMIDIKGGCFQMGSPDKEPERGEDENLHQICLKDYELGKYEVTQDLWKKVMGTNPSYCQGEKLPVESVSWNEVQEFIVKLNLSTGKKYRLPTEAEWEYAARAGTTTPFYTGNCIDTNLANFNGNNYTDCGKSISQGRIVAIGTYSSNGIGLYDMAGNVFEWTCSVYIKDYNGSETVCAKDTTATKMLAIRGGSFKSDANKLRSASRHFIDADYHDINFGFRLASDLAGLTKTSE